MRCTHPTADIRALEVDTADGDGPLLWCARCGALAHPNGTAVNTSPPPRSIIPPGSSAWLTTKASSPPQCSDCSHHPHNCNPNCSPPAFPFWSPLPHVGGPSRYNR